MESTSGTLYIVSTPIGNMEDITLRAIRILKEVDCIACEDTRHTRILTNKYEISKPLISFYSYNQRQRTEGLIKRLKAGESVALVSDAGTPGISDPGFVLIKAAIEHNISMDPIPGASAILTALVVSGKPTHKFVFEGFLSNKSSQRRKRLEELKNETRTVIFYESPHRIAKMLDDMDTVLGNPNVVCLRELTKKFQQIQREPARDLAVYYREHKPKGEFVVIL